MVEEQREEIWEEGMGKKNSTLTFCLNFSLLLFVFIRLSPSLSLSLCLYVSLSLSLSLSLYFLWHCALFVFVFCYSPTIDFACLFACLSVSVSVISPMLLLFLWSRTWHTCSTKTHTYNFHLTEPMFTSLTYYSLFIHFSRNKMKNLSLPLSY